VKTARILFLAAATLPLSNLSCQDPRVPSLEQRVNNLEQRTQQLETQRAADASQEWKQREGLRLCVANANDEYLSDIRSNGTKNGRDTVSVPVTAMAAMDRRKQPDTYENLKKTKTHYSLTIRRSTLVEVRSLSWLVTISLNERQPGEWSTRLQSAVAIFFAGAAG